MNDGLSAVVYFGFAPALLINLADFNTNCSTSLGWTKELSNHQTYLCILGC